MQLQMLHGVVVKYGFFSRFYGVCGRVFEAQKVFDELPQRQTQYLNSQLAAYSRRGDFRCTWDLFFHMHHASIPLDSYTFTPLLSACSVLPGSRHGQQIHALMIKLGADFGTVSKTALLDMYSKNDNLCDSVRVFEESEFRDVVIWNALLSSFMRHGRCKDAICVFGAIRRERVEFSEFTLCSVLKACASLKAFELGKQIHGLVVAMGRDLVVLGTALIDFYSGVGYVDEAIRVFSNMSSVKDDAMCNSLIAGYVHNRRYKEAFSLISRMRPNVVSLTTALDACSENLDLWIGMQIHCVALRFSLISSTQLCNALLDMYSKCGRLSTARLLFDTIHRKDVISWTSMIDAYGKQGDGHEALDLFKQMGQEGSEVLPNPVTFLALLSACRHSGLVEEGRALFNSVKESYGFEPGVEHYLSYIDILGKAGGIEDMWRMFDNMVSQGIKPTAAVMATLLNACIVNLDTSRGEFAAQCLLELEGNNPVNVVLVSKFYATIGKWDVVDSLRSNMRDKGLVKEAGSSWNHIKTNITKLTNQCFPG